ncbi:uncharacterized protein LOC5519385 isoform X2 [Nematostella vectensis]|uniref:uncharacterized protein LOC5519385 isoform X2 n=1 Tax=Nematostella vectensis TaxID=45351 RepID=UPI00207795B2|nr:uncharacterized protein LOC5519385 isoform X2 [Nematostella vectensis]
MNFILNLIGALLILSSFEKSASKPMTDEDSEIDSLLQELDSTQNDQENSVPNELTTHHEDRMRENKRISDMFSDTESTDADYTTVPDFDAGVLPFERVGCFRDKGPPHPLPKLIKSLRQKIDWNNMNKTIDACAKLVQAAGYQYFGIAFYGECWSGVDAHKTYAKDGSTQDCWSGVGKAGAYAVYRFKYVPTTSGPTTTPTTPSVPAECISYHELTTADRAMGNSGSKPTCDNTLSPGWYRFSGAAGKNMPTSCVQKHHCGTHAPGWLNGTLPSTIEGAASRQVCFHWGNDCCRWKSDIKVRNCGEFYVYQLERPPVCRLRYCGDAPGPSTPPPPTTAAPTTPAPTTPTDECSSYKLLDSSDRAIKYTGKPFLCDQNMSPGWYRFSGSAGKNMPTSCVPTMHCGTHAPGWLNGTLPKISEGAVTRQACFNWRNNCCFWKRDIKVRNCVGFYVYRLMKPPGCRLRYCGDNGPVPTTAAPTTVAPPPTTPSLPAECFSYLELKSSDRSMGNSNPLFTCDNGMSPRWYRFSGAAGSNMPTSCVPKNRCGTHAPGWLNGTLPNVNEGAVNRMVCFHWDNNCCRWNKEIRVRNCGGFYVYHLGRTPTCRLRYCGDAPALTTTAPPLTSPTAAPECYSYRSLNSADRAMSHISSQYTCDNNMRPGWYRFSGAAGTNMPRTCIPDHRCGAHAPGWMNGPLPDVDEGAATRKVCFHWAKNCCKWSKNIKVRNCGGFYVYQLDKPPACRLRYCGDKTHALTTIAPTTTPRPPTPALIRLCEHRSGVLNCPQNKRIKILYSNYGRTSGRSVCPHPSIRTTSCRSAESQRLIRCACNGRNACPLYAKNEVYGDPCVGTYKYIEVRYLCV